MSIKDFKAEYKKLMEQYNLTQARLNAKKNEKIDYTNELGDMDIILHNLVALKLNYSFFKKYGLHAFDDADIFAEYAKKNDYFKLD